MKPEVDPALVIRAYLWAVLKEYDPEVWNEELYDNLVPIVPLGEEPELSEFSGPQIIYVHNHSPRDGERSKGGMTLVIADNNFRRIVKVMNVLHTTFDRSDETARDINNFSTWHKVGNDYPFRGLRFGWVKTVYTEGPSPAETEGGRASASVDLDYEYYVDYDVITDVASYPIP